MNAVGVKAYASWSEGLTATIATLENGDYANIIAALRAGQNAAAVAAAVAVSPWGTQPFSLP
jgi:ribosomal protein L12E/L44/L45/RPP1/RPP2